MIGEPLDYVHSYNEAKLLNFAFPNGKVLVEKEELAHPLKSLVADIGGILGLFIGFNFLMFWDLFSFIQNYFTTYFK